MIEVLGTFFVMGVIFLLGYAVGWHQGFKDGKKSILRRAEKAILEAVGK